jgi:large subunit ribosomal protein L5
MRSVLYNQYMDEIRGKLQKDLDIPNPMCIPAIKKISVNVGMGSYLRLLGKKDPVSVVKNVAAITGQKPVVRNSKLSVSNFKLREGQPVGVSVTLRRQEAYNFLYKLIHVVYPRVRDFRGQVSNVFDANGNCTVGFSDFTVFPETVQPENSREVHGLQVTIVTSATDEKGARALLTAFGFPFKS